MKPHYIRAINSHTIFNDVNDTWNRDGATAAVTSKCAHEYAHTPFQKHTKKCLTLASNPMKKKKPNQNKNDMCAMK